MDVVSIKISRELHQRLDHDARRAGLRKSQLMRRILENHVRRTQRPEKASALTRLADLAGSVSGPGDLSVNPRYMDGYGR